MMRAILSVVVGYVVMFLAIFLLFSGLYLVLGQERSFQPGSYEPSALWTAVSFGLGAGAAVLGGYVSAAIARTPTPPKVLAGVVLVIGLLAEAFGVLAYVFVSTLGPFYAVAALVGFIYAGTMPLYAVIIRENFPLRMMGTIIGGSAMAGSLGMSTGPLLGGMIYDRFDSYALMYVGSWGMGLAAVLILMTFWPFPARQAEMAPA